MTRFLPGIVAAAAAFVALLPTSCTTKEPESSTYFDRTISPILTTSCVRANTGAGCHVADAKGNALGNLDLSTFAMLDKRRDLLLDYGPYGQPSLLVKNVDPFQIDVQTYDGESTVVTTDIKHAGGSIFDPTGSGYRTLRRWIESGATENNTGIVPKTGTRLPCSAFLPARGDFDVTKDPPKSDFAEFRDKANLALTGRTPDDPKTVNPNSNCAAGNCHGTVGNALYLTCGETPEQIRWNYLAAEEYLAQTPERSELLRRPLAPSLGGSYHEGGVIFASSSDAGYAALTSWAKAHGPLVVADPTPGFSFFSKKVQPVLVKKGCMMVQCHSAAMFHDYRLRGGSAGSFSLSATRKNYELSLLELSVESDDPSASRIVRKNLYRPEVCGVDGCESPSGLVHRGGPLFEDFGAKAASAKSCEDAGFDYDNGKLDEIPAYCVLGEWLKRERQGAGLAPLSAVVYVKRPLGGVGRPQDFDVYAPGADLRRAAASMTGGALAVTDDASLTSGCGLDPTTADIRRPQVSWDGAKIAFAARSSASEPLAVYEMNADGSGCGKIPEIDDGPPTKNGLLIHHFDPTYAPPDGAGPRIVFASTRGNVGTSSYDYDGPQRSPADPTKPNANLYVLEADPAAAGKRRVRQLTYLLDMEREPSFMNDGRVIFTAEKRAPDFYQLALRRLNLDGGDYHPLFAQRGSVAYPEATNVVELADKNFAAIFRTPKTPHGGGTLGIFNRSIGIDFQSTNAADYPIDPTVIDPASPSSPDSTFFLRSLHFPDPSVDAHDGANTSGFYTSPSPLPNARLLVSYGAGTAASFAGDYDVWIVNPTTGEKSKILGDPGTAEVDAVAVYGRFVRPVFTSTVDEPNANTTIVPGHDESEINVLDMRVLASLLFQNTPTGRPIETDLDRFFVYEQMPPPLDVDSFDKGGANVVEDAFGKVYVRQRLLGMVPIESDGSAKFNVPGGLPIVLGLPDTKASKEKQWPRMQREAMSFAPGEYAHQSFRSEFFDGLCGQCHGSISGRPVDTGLEPDFVTSASDTIARSKAPFVLNKPPAERGPIEGARKAP